jgi:hypothetical protein
MRIAVSGTHCCGKTTLIDEFLLGHPDFVFEPEPYAVLHEDYGESFAAEPAADDFLRQLEFNIDRLRLHKPGERVIYERSPIDFLAYMLALDELGRDPGARDSAEKSVAVVVDAIELLDLVVFLPIDDRYGIVVPESEDPELRSVVDERLAAIFLSDALNMFESSRPLVVEANGSPAERLKAVETALVSLWQT